MEQNRPASWTLFDPDRRRKTIIAMIHLAPLPGTPFFEEGSFAQTLELAVRSSLVAADAGADACLVQTVDRVYNLSSDSDPLRTLATGLIARAVVAETGGRIHVGVQLMRNDVRGALAVAKIVGGSFVRAGPLVGQTLTSDGIVQTNPYEVMDYRNRIAAWAIHVIADVDSMQFKWHGSEMSTPLVARAAQRVGAAAVALGHADETKTVESVLALRESGFELPILLAGYTNHQNAGRLLAVADGAFVGTCLEASRGNIDGDKLARYLDAVRRLER